MNQIKFIPRSRIYRKVFPKPEPVQSANNLPDWWKKQPGYVDGLSRDKGEYALTVKKCQAVFDAMTFGYYLKIPMDIFIDATGDKVVFKLSTPELDGQLLTHHIKEQILHYPVPDGYHDDVIRIHPMWIAETPPGFSCLFIQPMHSDNSPLFAIPGVIDTDRYPSDGYLSFFVKKGFSGLIKQGTPMVQVIPFQRNDWEANYLEDENSDDIIKVITTSVRTVFENAYRVKFWSKKTFK
jgi:hypothetical protein